MKKPRPAARTPGDVVMIALDDGAHSYARVLGGTQLAFYDRRADEDLPLERIVGLPVMFILAVHDAAFARPTWRVIGNARLDGALLHPPPRFVQDALHKDRFRIYENDEFRPATRQECEGLERASVWDASHVEDRLRDHYAGRPNKWVESQKIRS